MAKKIGLWLVFLALIVSGYFVWQNRYDIFDNAKLRSYTPSPVVAGMAADSGMNDYGRRIFYVHDPQILTKDQFNQKCTSEEQTIVLGCYNGKGIYIYNVDNQQIEGVKQVTAAHEMLHAAYDRLSPTEKSKINSETAAMLKNINDARINSLIEKYRQQDPNIVPNELHSVLGTEVKNLSPELEAYYGKYFTDRAKVVALSNQYEQVFNDAKNKSEQTAAKLALMKTQIEKQETGLEAILASLKSTKTNLDNARSSQEYTTYNNLVPGYNALVNKYNTEVSGVQSLIDEYNALVKDYNTQVTYRQTLVNSIDSKFKPQSEN